MKKVIIFGAGQDGRRLLKEINKECVFCFADNNVQLVDSYIEEIPIISFSELQAIYRDYLIIVASRNYKNDMIKQLQESGISNFCIDDEYRIDNIFNKYGKRHQRILLLNTHAYSNIGDHLITVAEHYFFRKYFLEYELLEITSDLYTDNEEYISQYINEDDVLMITGGGFLGSLWMQHGEDNVRDIIKRYPLNEIVILPQTLYFEDNAFGHEQKDETREIYNRHKNLTICLRDKASFELAQRMFYENVKKVYLPDMALLLDRSDEIHERDKITICIRTDKERVVSKELLDNIYYYLAQKEENVVEMTMHADDYISAKERMDKINEKLNVVQKSKLVITDRLHCMIMCAISGTPCIAINNLSGKVKGVYEWIKENVPYIFFWNMEDDIRVEIDKLLKEKPGVYHKEFVEQKFASLIENKKGFVS